MQRSRIVMGVAGLALVFAAALAVSKPARRPRATEQGAPVRSPEPEPKRAATASKPTTASTRGSALPTASPPIARSAVVGGMDDVDRVVDSVGLTDFADDPLGRTLTYHMVVQSYEGADAQTRYDESVRRLAQDPDHAAAELLRAYAKADPRRYLDRWQMIQTVEELARNATLSGDVDEALQEILRTEIPPEQIVQGHHSGSTVEEEVKIRLRAIDGLRERALRGSEQAESALLETAQTATERPLIEASVFAYLSLGDREARRAELAQSLPERARYALSLREAGAFDIATAHAAGTEQTP